MKTTKATRKNTWRTKPKIINKIPTDDTIILFIDESGEGHNSQLKKAFDLKEQNTPYNMRNDIFLLNGVCLSGK